MPEGVTMPDRTYRILGANVRRPPAAGEDYKRTAEDVELMLNKIVQATDPHAMVLLEVSRYHAMLRDYPGYDALIFDDPGRGDNAILIRSDIPHGPGYDIEHGGLAWWLTVRGSKSWGRAHVTAKIPGLRLVGVHTPPSVNWINKLPVGPALRIRVFLAMMTSLRKAIATWKRDEPNDGLLIFGDWNEPSTSKGEDSPSDVAADTGLTIFPSSGIDWSMGRNVSVSTRVIAKGREGNTSDHPLLDMTVTVAAPTPAPPTPEPEPQEAPVARQARSLDVLLSEVNRHAPKRSKASDGGLGDQAHSSRVSDHNPNRFGVWRARDFTNDPNGGFQADLFANLVARKLGVHPALGPGAYVIWNRRIISTNRLREGWRRYTGANGHIKHVHVSVGTEGYDTTAPWNVFAQAKVWQPGERDLVYREGRDVMSGPDVKFVQKRVGMGAQDGYYGPKTAAQVKAWEKAHNDRRAKPRLLADGVVGTGTWQAFGVEPKYKAK